MRGDEVPLYKIGQVCEILGVKQGSLRKWADEGKIKTIRTPGGMRLFDISSFDSSILQKCKLDEKSVILYSRVSSSKQKDDLQRQKQYLEDNLPNQCSGSKIIVRINVNNVSN